MGYGYGYRYQPPRVPAREPDPDLRDTLDSIVDRALDVLSALRPYARRADRADCDALHLEGMDLAGAIGDKTEALPKLCTWTDTWTRNVMHWARAVVSSVRGVWGKARTHFTRSRTEPPAEEPPPEKPTLARIEKLEAAVKGLEAENARLETKMDAGFTRLETQMDERFAQVDERFAQVDERFAQVDERFAQVDKRFEQVDERFASLETKVDEGFEQARRERRDIMETRRRGEQLEVRLRGNAIHTVESTLRPIYKDKVIVGTVWSDRLNSQPQLWDQLRWRIGLNADSHVQNIDNLAEITWAEPAEHHAFLVCEATLTLDHEHIAKLANACQEIAGVGYEVIGILGYVNASTAILDEARAADLILWKYGEDIVAFDDETAGLPLAERLRDMAAEVMFSEIQVNR